MAWLMIQTDGIAIANKIVQQLFLPLIQSPQVHLRHHRHPRLTLSGPPSPNAQCFSYCESESAEHYLLYLLHGDIGNGDNVVNYGMDGNVMPIT